MDATAILALTVAFGIAVDDTVHFLNRYRQALEIGLPRDAAIRQALATAGRAMVLTTILVCAGLLVTLTSSFFPVALFGGMIGASILVALFADLVLLPALLTLRRSS